MENTVQPITDPVELAARYGLPWPDDGCTCCGGKVLDGRCLGADRCDTGRCAGVFDRWHEQEIAAIREQIIAVEVEDR